MRIQLLVLALLLLLCHSYTTWPNTLCINCAHNISTSFCTKCQSTGCAAYTNFDSTTSQCSCKSGYYMNNDNSNTIYCDRCFIGCATCTGPLASQCLTCATNFVLNSNTSTCSPPLTASDYTIQKAYYFLGFNAVSGWSPTGVTTCSSTTLLGLTTGTYSVTFSNLKSHFAVRVMFAHYLSMSSSSINTNIQIGYDGTITNVPVNVNIANSNNPSLSCSGTATNFVQTYVDSSATHTATSNVTLTITTNGYTFGIREFYVILKLCDGVCTSCTGYTSATCTGCADTKRLANVTTAVNNFTGVCTCVGSYYQEPNAGACVQICPSFPVETFGDNSSRTCVSKCPNNSYAYTDSYMCWSDCPTTSVSGTLLFKDKLNWRCVTNCPTQAPYACWDASYRTCYANCPNTTNTAGQTVNYYAVNGISPQCVSVCPYNSTFTLFGYNGVCIPRCPNGTWGDPATKLCLSNCTDTNFLYKDSSSGSFLCVFTCNSLNYFRDNSTYTCVTTCPNTLYGQTTRECVSRCANGSFGLPFGNRKCVQYCPTGWWGEPDANVCVNTTAQCKTSTVNATSGGYYRYADNYTRTCVFPWQCSLGYYADNLTQSCVPQCPNSPTPAYSDNASVGYINSVCQITCQSPYFADYVAGLCVLDCKTNNTYADVSSTRTCVTACNSSGLTPWADNTTWTCVSICNSTGVAEFVSDNSTFTCVYNCPANSYADRITSSNPTCRLTCLNGTYADNSTGTGLCSFGCSAFPPRFGDPTGYLNLCVPICTAPLFGDTTGNRLCVPVCPTNFFSQNDTTRQCVTRCKSGSYGYNFSCLLNPIDCPAGTFANDATNLCDVCNATLGTWGDPVSKRCVTICPLNPLYSSSTPTSAPKFTYADVSIQQCVTICNSSHVNSPYTGLFGNNNTRSCMGKCSDLNAYAKIPASGGFRLCVARCYPYNFFANNETKVCVNSIDCPLNQFGENTTQTCVSSCPTGSWAYQNTTDKICIDICPGTWFADNSTTLNICVQNCPKIPSMFADSTTKKCVAQCPISGGVTYYADSTTQTCVADCPTTYYAYTPNRTCLAVCPTGYFGLNTTIAGVIVGTCVTPSSACGSLVADPYLNLCVSLCTGPTPVSLFAYNDDCLSVCPTTYYSNTYSGVRDCVQLCPPGVIDSTAAPNLYGDNATRSCVASCVTPLRWADPHTRLCQAVCSSNPPLYSEDFNYTCVAALACPTSPSMTFGDNVTRSCVSNCSNGTFGDPVSRSCLAQCQSFLATGTSTYYSDKSTGIYLCVTVCPILPALFGYNNTNTCVSECPQPLYGDQTGNRSCIATCPILGSVTYFAQNISRICVTVCISGTWGYTSSQQCVQTPDKCSSQWADNSTNLCVDVCPESMDTYADPTTKFCVPLCPNIPNLYFSDYTTRTCVQTCPAGVEEHGLFGNNETRSCEESCSPFSNGTILTYADPQTVKRYCVLKCSQSPARSFADPSTRTCVPICPTTPDFYGETSNFTCVSQCANGTYADTITRMCVTGCSNGQFKLTSPTNQCVTICPADQDVPLYGDSTGFCVASCTGNTFRYKTLSICVNSCADYGDFAFNMTCVQYCPAGYYADSSGICVTPCPGSTFGDNSTTTCVGTCITGFAYNNLCLAICPLGYYGENYVCVTSCQPGNTASNVTRTCISNCTNGTYAQNGGCFANCTSGSYADPLTNICSGSCSSPSYYASPLTNTCVQQCPPGYYISSGFCSTTCSGSYFADNVTWSCTLNCSTGYWGYNNLCLTSCPPTFYAYTADRICYSTSTFPTSIARFADNVTQTWVTVCPLNPLSFGDTATRYCIPACLGTNLADPSTNKCQSSCNDPKYFADYAGKQCVLVCPTGYFANSVNFKCQSICTTGYAYSPERVCIGTCPTPYSGYYNGTANICVSRCPNNTYSFGNFCGSTCSSPYYADNTTNQCVLSCVNSFASNDSWICVPSCASFTTYTIADNSTNQCVSICPSTPDYYAQNNICVRYCSNGTFADPTTGVRRCTSLCTDGLFSNPISGRCESFCPNNYWGQSLSTNLNRCESVCSIGFADNSTGLCKLTCPSPTYADPTTARCVKVCPNGYFGEVNNTCVQKCTLYNYANPLTRTCTPDCPSFAYLFAENTTAACVPNCSIVSNSYADRNINTCVSNCTLTNEYMLDGQAICTSLCPSGLFMENSTKRCQAQCTTGYAEPTSRHCVSRCFGNPQTYGYLGVCYFKCPSNSTTPFYADNSSNLCVNPCPIAFDYFSDPLSGNCVKWCPEGYFSQTTGRTCSPTCTVGFADNLTRSCVTDCPTAITQTYGDTVAHTCVRICPPSTYADNATLRCVNPCPNNTWADDISKYCVKKCPSEPLTFGLNSSTTCVARCPSGFYGDFQSQTCVSSCPIANNSQFRFADPVSQICVFVCPINASLYGDTSVTSNFSCVSSCYGTQLKDNSTQRCVSVCPSKPSYWADTVNRKCVYNCPSSYFASNRTDRLCVQYCSAYFTFGDVNSQICSDVCPENYWADNSTYLCVDKCPSTPDFYADNTTKSCVYYCPKGVNWTTFADSQSRRCVTECPDGYFGVNSTQRCEQYCPNGTYADPIIRVCVANCTVRPHYYKTSSWTCVFQCPTTPVIAYKLDTINICVYTDNTGNSGCPSTYWADPTNNTCTQLCPDTYFADQVKQLCVQQCPAGKFADKIDRLCKSGCSLTPEEYRLDLTPGICVQFCPDPLYADNSTYYCVPRCPSTPQIMYSYDITRTCVLNCPPPYYSYVTDNACRLNCTGLYFAQDSTRSCELTCLPPYYADDSTNRCVLMCPQGPNYFGHNNVCIRKCPNGTFADNSTRLCVSNCTTQPQTFADNSTNMCVSGCPSTPNFFADNTTMTCVYNCAPNLFAEVTTRTCVIHCPSNLMTYADPTTGVCQPSCPPPYFASDLTKQCVLLCPNTPVKTYARTNGRVCVTQCPGGTYAENISRTCASDCTLEGNNSHVTPSAYADINSNICVSTCPYGWFGNNDTLACTQQCPYNTYADNYTRRCLSLCPGTERLYADISTSKCVSTCPTNSYGNSVNWTCITSCPPSVFGYQLDLGNLCIPECPAPYFAYTPTRKCVTDCGAGFFGSSATRICSSCPSVCPTCVSLSQCLSCTTSLYLSFGTCTDKCPTGVYANNGSMTCVYAARCPSGTFGNNQTASCSATCPVKQFADAATKMCMNCPQTCQSCKSTSVCLTCITNAAFSNQTKQCYAYCSPSAIYNYNGTCFPTCPNGTYLDYTNINCQACNSICSTCSFSATNCTSCSSKYLYNFTCLSQCPTNMYGSNGSCLVCTSSVPSCSKPLSFSVTTSTENYQTVVYLTFNQKTTINGKVQDILSLNLKPKRMLQASVVNNGLQYTSEVMPDGTIKLTLAPGVTLTNPSFTISITNPSMITTSSGQTLQSLTAELANVPIISFPPGSASDAPLVIAGTILSVFMLILLAAIFVCTPLPAYLTIQAFQMIAFYALVIELPPNLFYFMQKLSLSRLSFLPNIFAGVYQPPSGFSSSIPAKVTDLDGYFGFSMSAGSYFFVMLIYLFISLVVYGLSSKYNSNRPLRELFSKIYNIRVKWGIVNDLLWLFSLNIFVCGFMQFRYTENAGDVVLAVFSLLIFLGLPIALFIHHLKQFDSEDEEVVDNYRFIHEGLSDGTVYRNTIFIYYLRKILFAVVIASTIAGPAKSQCIALIVISSLMLVYLVIVRPFQDKLRNLIHILHEIGLTFLGGAMLYYQHYVEILQPVGTKIICGTIITIVIIAHLSIALIWGYFKAYNFYKKLYKDFKVTQFFQLYLDQKYDESLEKELRDLNDETTGEIQSVQLTNMAENELHEDENVIKLKIKRRRKINKNAVAMIVENKVPRNQGEYVRIQQTMENQSIVPLQNAISPQKYQKMSFQQINRHPMIIPDLKSQASWEEMAARKSEHLKTQNIFEPVIDQDMSELNPGQFNFAQMQLLQPPAKSALEIEEISSVSNKEERISKEEGDQHIRESLNQIGQNTNQPPIEEVVYEQQEFEIEEEPVPAQQYQALPQPSQPSEMHSQQHQQPLPIHEKPKVQEEQANNKIPQMNEFNIQQEASNNNEEEWQQMSDLNSKKDEKMSNFIINLDLQQPEQEQAKEQEAKVDEVPPKNNNWNIEIDELLMQQQKKETNKKHLLLFDEQDFQ